ncbi:MAG: WG repeat-containing protein [Bacteroidetes bacterium]|nr:WG repeat-containing protein [Bacteroidota bacterium]
MALPFNGKLALVVSSNKIGFIDNEGKYVINPQFDDASRDLVEYFQTGGSIYSNVQTDFFNVGAITSRIKTDAPEGLSFNSTMSEILAKFKKSQEDFSKYNQEHMMISSEKITNDATLNFYILGSPWVSNGYYDYTFNAGQKPRGFAYIINLTSNGYGKEDAVKTAIETSLKGYTKDPTMSNETEAVYKNAKQSVKIFTKNGNVVIVISVFEHASDMAVEETVAAE